MWYCLTEMDGQAGDMMKILMRYRIRLFYIDVEQKEEYYNAFEIADKGKILTPCTCIPSER